MSPHVSVTAQKTTARLTGLSYLLLALCGVVSFLLVRPVLHAPHDAALTLKQVTEHFALARLGLGAELGTVVTQAVVAVFFFKLFREVDMVSAGATAAFGLINSTAILGSAACLATALAVIRDVGLAPGGDVAATVQLLYELSSKAWSVSAIFFGLWLIPMGHAARVSGVMPKALGWTLTVGGLGYVANAFAAHTLEGAPSWLLNGLTLPATIGEFWMIGFLLFVGWRATPST